MESIDNNPIGEARDDIEFLVSSWNRLDVLAAIMDEPKTRGELREAMSVSRVTLSRILSDLETRGWIARAASQYEATKAGEYVASDVIRLIENVRALNRLGENIDWIRLDEFDFDLSCLQTADIIMPSWDDFSAQTRALVDLVYESATLKGIATGLDREFMQALADATTTGELSLELILLPKVIDAITDTPELARLFSDLADAPTATLYRYRGPSDLMELGIHVPKTSGDTVVMLCGEYEDGAPPGTIESTDPTVVEWAESYFEATRGASRELKAAVFTP